ncbi:hypothetical protein GOP47_0024323 [Adiantum capillus-veneris]|uniref:Uncharacterized protein n=1 Tax=Adiantum capillus-veneris TaxID=13818 RepID=A0A9D4Z2P3_ADICA|nr:hypothetical protein GOP47_0024323 [Adiantum capillus-veneris]
MTARRTPKVVDRKWCACEQLIVLTAKSMHPRGRRPLGANLILQLSARATIKARVLSRASVCLFPFLYRRE